MSELSYLKQGFFSKPPQIIKKLSYHDDFNLNQLKFEFLSLSLIIDSNKSYLEKESEIVAYFNQLCDLLIDYYQRDYVAADLKGVLKKKKELGKFVQVASKTLIEHFTMPFYIKKKINSKTKKLLQSLQSSAAFREFISSLITNRTYWNYSRGFANRSLLYLLKSDFAFFLRKINELIGFFCTPEQFLQLLDKTQGILRALSFSLFALRLLINLSTLIKHLYLAAISPELSLRKVLLQELMKRAYIMVNDIYWCIVNLLTNYNRYFSIPLPIINQLNLAFLAVDILMFLASLTLDFYHYYQRKKELKIQLEHATSTVEISLINRQIDVLDDEWELQFICYVFNIIAALIIVSAFGATLAYSGPLLLIGFAFLTLFGNAIYNSGLELKNYAKSLISVKREEQNGLLVEDSHHLELLQDLKFKCNHSEHIFWNTLLFHTCFTSFILITAAISWPLALTFTLSYLGFCLLDNYEEERQKNEKKSVRPDIYRFFSIEQSNQLVVKDQIESLNACKV